MPRIVGVDIPANKRVVTSLTYIYGIGPAISSQVLKEAQIDEELKARDMTEDEVARVAGIIDRTYKVEGELRRTVQSNIARLRTGERGRGSWQV